MMSSRERSSRRKNNEDDVLMLVKDSLHKIFTRAAGLQSGPPRRIFSLRDEATDKCDTVLLVDKIRYDVCSNTVLCDAFVLSLAQESLQHKERALFKLFSENKSCRVTLPTEAIRAWKKLLPALAERCRNTWSHQTTCEYITQEKIPLSTEMEDVPLCSCGSGKETATMAVTPSWKDFAPYATRIALCPLFAVSYLERVLRDPLEHKCAVCRGKGRPKLKACGGCQKVRYCSEACQKKDWGTHKAQCQK